MAFRYRRGDETIKAPVISSTYSIGVHEMVLQDAQNGIQNVSAATYNDEAHARKYAAAHGLGQAWGGSDTDESRDVNVMPEGVFEMPCTSTTPTIGTLFGPEKDSGGSYLDTDKLQKVESLAEATHVCTKHYGSATTTVEVRLLPPRLLNPRFGETFFPGDLSAASAHRSSTPAEFISGYKFGRRVKLLEGLAVVGGDAATLSSDYGVVFLKNGSQIMVSLSVAVDDVTGDWHSCDFTLESSNAHIFEADDALTIHGEGPVGAGEVRLGIGVRYIEYA